MLREFIYLGNSFGIQTINCTGTQIALEKMFLDFVHAFLVQLTVIIESQYVE